MFNGSVPSTSPLTNSYPLISFCCSALTVPYVLMRGLDILPPGFRCFELHLRCRGLHFVSCCRIRYQLHSREIQIKRLFLARPITFGGKDEDWSYCVAAAVCS